jgi:acyl-CoA synthetase (AMP-forming)/AMP-acid ligase II
MATENYDPCYPDQPVVHRYLPVWAKLPAFGTKPAFIWADDDTATGGMKYSALTYSQLDAAVERMASGLLGTVRRGDTVLVLASPGLRLVKLLFACQRAGLTAVPVIPPNPSRPGPAHAHLLRAVLQTRPSAAVADARYVADIAGASGRISAALSGLRWLSVEEVEGGEVSVSSAMAGHTGCGSDDAYLIQYTSGATGVPKPVVVTAGSAAHNVRAARRAYDLGPGSMIVSWLPQYHDCGLMFLLLTVASGATCVLASPDAFLRRPRLWLELISEFRATCTPVPSFTLPLVLRRGGRSASAHGQQRPVQLGSLRNLILINEPIYKACVDEFVKEFGRDGLHGGSISPSYGLAENCTFVSTAWRSTSRRAGDLPSYKKLLPSARLSPSMAHEAPEIEIAVVNEENGEPVADGVEGEVWVSSPSNASGYLGHPSASLKAFCARVPGRAGSSCFIRTGDRGVITGAERYLYIVGRGVDVVTVPLKDGGARLVHAHYIETAAFGSAPDRLRGGCIAAFTAPAIASPEQMYVVAEMQKGGGRDDHRGLSDRIRRALWEVEGVRVGRVMLVEAGAVPKTTSGKVRRGAARQKLNAGKFPVVFEALYEDGDGEGSVRGVDNEEGAMEERCAASWVAREGGAPAMATAFGSASDRLRARSFL